MSWWDTGEGDDVIGDRPADLLISGLKKLGAEREAAGKERPSLGGLLAGLSAALSGPERQVQFVGETKAGPLPAGGAAAETEAAELLPGLREALQAITASYEERWERGPRPSELAWLTAFVLGGDPWRYLRPEPGVELTDVRVQVQGA